MELNPIHTNYFCSTKWKRFRSRYLTLQYLAEVGWKIVRFVILFGLCYIILYPFFIKIVNGFKDAVDFSDTTVRFIPKNFTLHNIFSVVDVMDFGNSLKNTFLVSAVVAVLQTAVSAMVGYGFAKFKFKLNKLIFFMVIFSLIVPPQTIIISLFLRFRFFLGFINLIDTPFPIFILSLTGLGIKNALYIFLFRQFFRNSPKELEEAAYIDGCGTFRTFVRIMLPSAASLLITTLLLSFSWQWTDTTYSSLFLRDFHVLANMVPLAGQISIDSLIASSYVGIAGILSILPVAVIYICAQKYFVQSINTSGLVG